MTASLDQVKCFTGTGSLVNSFNLGEGEEEDGGEEAHPLTERFLYLHHHVSSLLLRAHLLVAGGVDP